MTVKVDLHVHTTFSEDSIITPKQLISYARKSGLNCVAVTDHNTIEGALKIAKDSNDFLVIPGTEVSSKHGHIVALNVQEKIPRDLTADETVDRVHKAGGIAIACHPFALFKGSIGKYVTRRFDAVETLNASAFPFESASEKANVLAEKLNLPKVAGTDAHFGPIIGRAFTQIDCEANLDSILDGILKGRCQPMGKGITFLMRLKNQGRFLKKYVNSRGQSAS
jgi:predicted metal-dependent phosphoesterase TrpH